MCCACDHLNKFGEVVGHARVEDVDGHTVPIVGKREVLRDEAVGKRVAAAERFHHQQMVQLVVSLGVVYAHELHVFAHAERLIEMQAREV